jgi:toxin ParE1/3/4
MSMAVFQLVISPAAKADLKNIHHYGMTRWGKSQADTYLDGIKSMLWRLVEHPQMGPERPVLRALA